MDFTQQSYETVTLNLWKNHKNIVNPVKEKYNFDQIHNNR